MFNSKLRGPKHADKYLKIIESPGDVIALFNQSVCDRRLRLMRFRRPQSTSNVVQ